MFKYHLTFQLKRAWVVLFVYNMGGGGGLKP